MFQIFELPLGHGRLGVSPLPGRGDAYDADLIGLLQWNPDLVISMTTHQEMELRGASALGADLANSGTEWAHLPVRNFGTPTRETSMMWESVSKRAHRFFATQGRVLVHCFQGCGRSGMAALRLMVEAGEAPEPALVRLRKARACAVETDAQFRWSASGALNG